MAVPPPPPPRNLQQQQPPPVQALPTMWGQQPQTFVSAPNPAAVQPQPPSTLVFNNHAVAPPRSNNLLYGSNQPGVMNPASQVTTQPSLDIIAEMARQALSGLPNTTTTPTTLPSSVSKPTPAHSTVQRTDPRANLHNHQKQDPRVNHYDLISQSNTNTGLNRLALSNDQRTGDSSEIAHVTVKDLSPMIQYSLKNLQASGFLDGKELGLHPIRLLKRLPEPEALQALERFSSCDITQMRSKEGYLCGILRKAVDKKN